MARGKKTVLNNGKCTALLDYFFIICQISVFAVSTSQDKENLNNRHKESKHEIKTPRKNLDFTTADDASAKFEYINSHGENLRHPRRSEHRSQTSSSQILFELPKVTQHLKNVSCSLKSFKNVSDGGNYN